jgi:hypothetical protein
MSTVVEVPTTSRHRLIVKWTLRSLILMVSVYVVFAGLIYLDVAAYQRSEHDPASGFLALPSWTLVPTMVLGGGLAAVALVGFALWLFSVKFHRSGPLVGVLGFLTLVITGIAATLTSLSLVGLPVPSYLQSAPDAHLTRMAQQAFYEKPLRTGCVKLSGAYSHLLGGRSDMCRWLIDQLEFVAVADNPNELIYKPNPGLPLAWDSCIHYLGGHWWAVMDFDNGDGIFPPSGQTCPRSFQNEGAG